MNKGNQKGITLIALIITIIVMLILVAVTVRTAVNSGLFGHAKDATEKWGDAQEKEGNIGNGKITIDGTEYESMDEYISAISRNNTYMLAVSNGGEYAVTEYFFMVTGNKDYQFAGTMFDDYENCYFRNYLDLYIKEADGNRKVFDNNVKSGTLCDNYGNYIMGYIVDEATGTINKDTLKTINISTESDTQRKGTRIDEKGNIYAIYEDETETLIAQIAIVSFPNPAGLQLSKTRPEVYKGTLNTGGGYIQDLNENEGLEIKNVTEKAEKETIYNTIISTPVLSSPEFYNPNEEEQDIKSAEIGFNFYDEENNTKYILYYLPAENKCVCTSRMVTTDSVLEGKYMTEQEFENLKKEVRKYQKFWNDTYIYMTKDEYIEKILNIK